MDTGTYNRNQRSILLALGCDVCTDYGVVGVMIEPRRRVVKKGNCYYPQRAVWMFYRSFRDKNGEILCFRSLEEAQRVCWDDADKEKFERRQKQKVFYCD